LREPRKTRTTRKQRPNHRFWPMNSSHRRVTGQRLRLVASISAVLLGGAFVCFVLLCRKVCAGRASSPERDCVRSTSRSTWIATQPFEAAAAGLSDTVVGVGAIPCRRGRRGRADETHEPGREDLDAPPGASLNSRMPMRTRPNHDRIRQTRVWPNHC
jgi:hypothetical protein